MKSSLKLLLLIIPIITLQVSFAHAQQKASDKVIAETCDCFKKLNMDQLSEDSLREKGMNCLMNAMTLHISDIAGEYGYELTELNAEVGTEIGKKIGSKMVQECPQSVKFFMVMGQEGLKNGDISPENAAYSRSGTTEGKVIRIDHENEIMKLILETEGEKESFYWIRPFIGSEEIETDLKSLVDKKVSISWGEFEKYVYDMKGYATVKEITAMKVL